MRKTDRNLLLGSHMYLVGMSIPISILWEILEWKHVWHWFFSHASSYPSVLDQNQIFQNLYQLQRCTNPGHQVAQVTKFWMVMPNICGSSVWNLLHMTHLAPRILKWLLEFWSCAPLAWYILLYFLASTVHHFDCLKCAHCFTCSL